MTESHKLRGLSRTYGNGTTQGHSTTRAALEAGLSVTTPKYPRPRLRDRKRQTVTVTVGATRPVASLAEMRRRHFGGYGY